MRLLRKRGYELVTPEYIFEEVRRKEDKLLKYSKLEVSKLWYLLFLSFKRIKPVPIEEYSSFLEEAKEISPPEDFPYAALALKYVSLGLEVIIWSNDLKFREALEGRIEVVSTPELIEKLRLV